jgi:hypothetical protein
MIANIHNENFGYAVACEGNWAAIGNPALLRYTSTSASFIKTGSVEVYRYNINTDTHDLKKVLQRAAYPSENLYLIIESASAEILHTELTGSVPYTADLDLLIDLGNYYTASEDGYGRSLDIHNTVLVVGNPYYSSSIQLGTSSFLYAGSGSVDLFDLTRLDVDPYLTRLQPQIVGYGISSSVLVVEATVPASQSFGYVLLEASETGSDYQKISIVVTTNNGGNVILNTNYPTTSVDLALRVSGIVSTDPYVSTIDNPHTEVTNSFGWDVSRNNDWLAVSSIYTSGSKGAVFMYQKVAGNEASWSLYQTLLSPSDIVAGDCFGWSIDLNKATGSFSGSMVVGSAKPSQSRAYVYELLSGSWVQSFYLYPEQTTAQDLTFFPTLPYFSASAFNSADRFGYDVAIYGDTIVVGAPNDRLIYEYTGSSLYHQGAVYFFERCANASRGYYLARKSYGNEKILKDNSLGWSVSVNGDLAVAGCPKYYMTSSICYLRGTLYQQHYCGDPDEIINGQFVLFNKTTGSIPDTTGQDWEITNVYQTKKRLLHPHRAYGYATDICDNFITIGAPMLISGDNRVMDLTPTTASFTGSVYDLGDLTGKAYIYNLKNFREEFYVGNVFYRNGKMVIMTSGSAFEGILQSDVTGDDYEYDMDFKSKQVIFEKQVVCPIDPGEFNVSTNPTAVVISHSLYDLNQNGQFDFQDVDVLLRYMKYKSTEATGYPITDWSSSLINTNTDEEVTVYNMYSSLWIDTPALFTKSFSDINNNLVTELDFNEDNKIDNNDMNILWKYFIYRLNQQNYETYITPNSSRKYLSDIIDYMNARTMRGQPPQIHTNFSNYGAQSKADPTGSYLASYVTTVGLYNGCDLVAVAKLGSPIKITPDFPINIVVKMDF